MVAILQSGLEVSGNVMRASEQGRIVISSRPDFLAGHVDLLKVASHCHGPPYVSIQSPLIASSQQDDDIAILMLEVHAISRAVVDTKLTDTASNGPRVACKAERQSIHAHLNTSSRLSVTQAAEPLGKDRRLAQFDHSA
jgi:hypothetical protein